MAFYVFWIAVAIYHHHGTSRVVYIVNQSVTLFGGYLIGRVMIRNAADYRRFFTWLLWMLVVFLPFAVFEFAFSRSLVDLASPSAAPAAAPAACGSVPPGAAASRHPILFGLYCSIVVANFFYIFHERTKRLWDALAMAMTFMSLSSGPHIARSCS